MTRQSSELAPASFRPTRSNAKPPPIKLVTIDDTAVRRLEEGTACHFGDSGIFDQIYKPQ